MLVMFIQDSTQLNAETIKGNKVVINWWFITPRVKLTEPVLSTTHCCHEHADEILPNLTGSSFECFC